MGIDIQWSSIPDSSPLLNRVRAGEFLEDIQFLRLAYEGRGSDRGEFTLLARGIVKDRADILKRCYFHGEREYAMIAYLISEEFRNDVRDPEKFRSIASKLIYGDAPIHPNAQSTQGFTIRYLAPNQVKQADAFLESFAEEDFFVHFDPERMERTAVYCFRESRANDYRAHILESFRIIRSLFHASARQGDEGLLVIRD